MIGYFGLQMSLSLCQTRCVYLFPPITKHEMQHSQQSLGWRQPSRIAHRDPTISWLGQESWLYCVLKTEHWELVIFFNPTDCAICHLSGNVHAAHTTLVHRPCALPHPKCWVDVIWGLACFLSFTVTGNVGSSKRIYKYGD